MSLRSSQLLFVLALALPVATAPVARANAADAGSLTCKLSAANTVITNNGTEPLAAGTKIVIRLYRPVSAFAAPTQNIVPLKSELSPGGTVTLPIKSSGPYESCVARKA